MVRRGFALAILGTAVALAIVVAASARNSAAPAAQTAQTAAAVSCSNARIGTMGPWTGPAASIGQEQLKFEKFALA